MKLADIVMWNGIRGRVIWLDPLKPNRCTIVDVHGQAHEANTDECEVISADYTDEELNKLYGR